MFSTPTCHHSEAFSQALLAELKPEELSNIKHFKWGAVYQSHSKTRMLICKPQESMK